MAPYVRYRLHFPLLRQLFGLLLFLLDLEAFRCSFELLFIDDKEVAGTSLGEVRLRQDVLDTRDGTHVALLVDVL